MEKINDTDIKEVVSRPDIEVVHNLDDLLEKKYKIKEEIAVLKLVLVDLQVLIDGARALGVRTREEVKATFDEINN